MAVAEKLAKNGAPLEARLKLLEEAAILGQFRHRHVVSLVSLGQPVTGFRSRNAIYTIQYIQVMQNILFCIQLEAV